MASSSSPRSLGVFQLNMEDARKLVAIAKALTNQRQRRMRQEKREAVGAALGVAKKYIKDLDCIESADFFVVLKPGTELNRAYFDDVKPLLRQALVAGCAALETFVGDRVMELLGPVLRAKEKPKGLLTVPMTVHDWYHINATYTRKSWGVRELVEEHVRLQASPSPSKIGEMFEIVGIRKITSLVDGQRTLTKESTRQCLEAIYDRRNRIAHQGDRIGRGRAAISVDEVERDLGEITLIVEAIAAVTKERSVAIPSRRRSVTS